MSNRKLQCFDCKHKKELMGSAHVSCSHPKLETTNNPMGKIFGVLLGARNVPFAQINNPIAKLDPKGVEKGWCNFPYDFDPIWILECKGYEPK